jgi:hypothetical protein
MTIIKNHFEVFLVTSKKQGNCIIESKVGLYSIRPVHTYLTVKCHLWPRFRVWNTYSLFFPGRRVRAHLQNPTTKYDFPIGYFTFLLTLEKCAILQCSVLSIRSKLAFLFHRVLVFLSCFVSVLFLFCVVSVYLLKKQFLVLRG